VVPLDQAPLRSAVERLADYQWLVLTSQNAVALLWDALRAAGLDARALAAVRVACVGKATSDALLARGLAADVVPPRFVAEGVLEALAARDDVRGARVLYVAAAGARTVLPEGLRTLGCAVEVVPAYHTVSDGEGAEALRTSLARGEVDAMTFASASAVRGLVDAVGEELARRAPAISIGPVTSDAVRAAGIPLTAESATATIEALVAVVVATLGEAT
jgi:uroporphyrinogen-III synthase